MDILGTAMLAIAIYTFSLDKACGLGCANENAAQADNKCYFLTKTQTTWVNAAAACAQADPSAGLATFGDEPTFKVAGSALDGDCVTFWIGLSDREQEAGNDPTGSWKWTDERPYTWSLWLDNFPVADLAGTGLDLDCVAHSAIGMANNPCAGPISQLPGVPASYCSACVTDSVFGLPLPTCPRGELLTDLRCYEIDTTPKTWDAAKSGCEAVSMKLASIPDAIASAALLLLAANDNCPVIWIGLNDKATEAGADPTGPWAWDDGSSSSFRQWAPTFPLSDDLDGLENDCVLATQLGFSNGPCEDTVTACPLCMASAVEPTQIANDPCTTGEASSGCSSGTASSLLDL